MKPFAMALAAALLPLSLSAQPAGFDVSCLPAAQQQEALTRARAITTDIEQRRPQVEAALKNGFTLADAQSRQDAVTVQLRECTVEARRSGRSTLEACERQLVELRVLADVIVDLSNDPKKPVALLEREQRLRLDSLRTAYPGCSPAATAQR